VLQKFVKANKTHDATAQLCTYLLT